ncbi:MAG: hypothetical protein M3Q46_12820, partial [Verrucomicrobiota bacterium]|nr:hypothetical protein [Verrucomicrobiota bacterium]
SPQRRRPSSFPSCDRSFPPHQASLLPNDEKSAFAMHLLSNTPFRRDPIPFRMKVEEEALSAALDR